MEVIGKINEIRSYLTAGRHRYNEAGVETGTGTRTRTGTVGLIPTMGFLHEGHLSLFEEARKRCSIVVLSIFVNPMQFGPNEDYEKYPRNMEQDLAMARKAGVDLVFIPDVQEMYPYYPLLSKVTVTQITARLCALSRPGHFDGVATVVLKLFNIIEPDLAFFGLKDAQQIGVVQQFVSDFNLKTRIVPCPTLREPDGLAMSSRNVYLNSGERQQAVVLNQALEAARIWVQEDKLTIGELNGRITGMIEKSDLAEIDYVDILAYPSFEPISENTVTNRTGSGLLVALAVKFGSTRLIDNCIIPIEGGEHLV